MANDLNRCEFIGRLGNDPEMRYLSSGEAIANFSIACNYKNKEKDTTEWLRISAFGKLAGICGDYLKKGSQVYVAGRLRKRTFQTKEGVEQTVVEIMATEMQMLGNKSDQSVQQSKPKPDAYRQIKEGNIADLEDDLDSVPF